MKRIIVLISIGLFFGACSSVEVDPRKIEVELSREEADSDCKEIGPVEGRTITAKGTLDEAIEDLKKDAAGKGANYVVIKKTSAIGSSINGIAYLCQ